MSGDGTQAPASGTMPGGQDATLVGQILDGRYRITRKLGEGGMGEVYAAEHIHIEKRFAIKLLRPEIVSNAEAVQRFRQEARSSSSIGHRNIIAIDDFGTLPDGRVYMCMELLNGAALNDLITTPQPVDRLLNILIQTGHGLAAAHAKGIVHRDMKPENIFVTMHPTDGDVPKILDFGIAKVAGNEGGNNLTKTGTIFGTPFYMAPEQALGNPVDARTDVYAMGVIMYEVFAGSLPFQGESFMGILTQHITTEPEPVAQRAAKGGRSLPPGLADIITRCMQKNPAQRFQTMDELVASLVQIYRGIAGAGMSTYMEAFPVNPTSGRMPVPTPGPITGPVSGGLAATVGVGGPPMAPLSHTPQGMPPVNHPTGPITSPPGTGPNYPVSGSGLYDPNASVVSVPKKSKAGLIVAIIAVLGIGAGIAAFLVVSNQEEGNGSGSQVASGSDPGSGSSGSSGSSSGTDPGSGSGSSGGNVITINGSGSSDVGSAGSNDVGSAGSNAGGSNAGGSNDVGSAGSNGPDVGSAGSNGSTVEPPPQIDAGVAVEAMVAVPLKLKKGGAFEVYDDNDNKLFDGPGDLEVPKGGNRKVRIKAKGMISKDVVVFASMKEFQIKLDKQTTVVTPPPGCTATSCPANQVCKSGKCQPKETIVTPPPVNCTKVLNEPRNPACVKQFCATHPNDMRCDLE